MLSWWISSSFEIHTMNCSYLGKHKISVFYCLYVGYYHCGVNIFLNIYVKRTPSVNHQACYIALFKLLSHIWYVNRAITIQALQNHHLSHCWFLVKLEWGTKKWNTNKTLCFERKAIESNDYEMSAIFPMGQQSHCERYINRRIISVRQPYRRELLPTWFVYD